MTSTSMPQRPRAQRGGIEDHWHKKAKDADGHAIEVPSSNYGKVTCWRARYVDNAGLDVKVVQARLRHASAKTTLDTYGHLWPDRDDISRAAVATVYAVRPEGKAMHRGE